MSQHRGKIDVKVAMEMEADRYDVIEGKNDPNERTLCGCVERSPRGSPEWDWNKFYPGGTVQAKVMDGRMADKLQLWAALGHPGGPDFIVADYLKEHSDNEWMRGLLRDMRSRPWTFFTANMKPSSPAQPAP